MSSFKKLIFSKPGKWNLKNSLWHLSQFQQDCPKLSNNFNSTMRRKKKSNKAKVQVRSTGKCKKNEWFANGGRHGGFTQRTKVSHMHEHTSVHTSLNVDRGRQNAAPICVFLYSTQSLTHSMHPDTCAQGQLGSYRLGDRSQSALRGAGSIGMNDE